MVTESSRLSHAEDKPFSLMEDWRGCAAGEHITWETLVNYVYKRSSATDERIEEIRASDRI